MVSMGDGMSVVSGMGGAGNGLLNNLIIYGAGDELAGNLIDYHTNGLDLNDVNTVTSNPGWSYPLARQYTLLNNEYHARLLDDALLSIADLDFTLASCVYLDSKPGVSYIASKYMGGSIEYGLGYWGGATDRFRWFVGNAGAVIGDVYANVLGSPGLGAWYLVVAWHDSVANTVSIQVNNAAADSAATTGIPANGTANFMIGSCQAGVALSWDGRANPTMFWKSAAGGGGVLTAAQRTQLWNGGAPLTYAAFTT